MEAEKCVLKAAGNKASILTFICLSLKPTFPLLLGIQLSYHLRGSWCREALMLRILLPSQHL
jgi:hypothetical protein